MATIVRRFSAKVRSSIAIFRLAAAVVYMKQAAIRSSDDVCSILSSQKLVAMVVKKNGGTGQI